MWFLYNYCSTSFLFSAYKLYIMYSTHLWRFQAVLTIIYLAKRLWSYTEIPIIWRLMVQKFCAGGRWFGSFEPKNHKGICKNATKMKISPEKYRYLEWAERRGDKGKNCTSTARKIGQTYKDCTWKIRMERSDKWSTTGISFGTNNVFSIRKWHDRRSKQLYKPVCRWYKKDEKQNS